MRTLFFLIIALSFQPFSWADTSYSLRIGQSLSFHPFIGPAAVNFENKVTSSGRFVHNQKFTLNHIEEENKSYNRKSILYAKDCVDSPIYGFGFSNGIKDKTSQIGFIFGGYFMDRQPWEERLIPKFWINVNKNLGFVPIVGVEYNLYIIKGNRFNLMMENFFSPLLTNHALSLEVRF